MIWWQKTKRVFIIFLNVCPVVSFFYREVSCGKCFCCRHGRYFRVLENDYKTWLRDGKYEKFFTYNVPILMCNYCTTKLYDHISSDEQEKQFQEFKRKETLRKMIDCYA